MGRDRRGGFSLVELLVVAVILALLFALIVPAVQYSRAAARATTCRSHLRQFGLALQGHHEQHGHYPVEDRDPIQTKLLPFLEQQTLYEKILDPPAGMGEVARSAHVPVLTCPDDPQSLAGESQKVNYGVNAGSTGFFAPRRYDGLYWRSWPREPVRARDVSDGLSNTAAATEFLVNRDEPGERWDLWSTLTPPLQPPDSSYEDADAFADRCRALPLTPDRVDQFRSRGNWFGNGILHYDHVMPPNTRSCVYGEVMPRTVTQNAGAFVATSNHAGGVNVLLADGAVRFIADEVEMKVWRALGSRDGGESVTLGSE